MGSAGAAVGAGVAGADAYLNAISEEHDIEELCGKVLPRSEPVRATPEQVAKYHDTGKFLDRLKGAYAKIMSSR